MQKLILLKTEPLSQLAVPIFMKLFRAAVLQLYYIIAILHPSERSLSNSSCVFNRIEILIFP